eukprot:3582467-Amphidinium_carterae.2
MVQGRRTINDASKKRHAPSLAALTSCFQPLQKSCAYFRKGISKPIHNRTSLTWATRTIRVFAEGSTFQFAVGKTVLAQPTVQLGNAPNADAYML